MHSVKLHTLSLWGLGVLVCPEAIDKLALSLDDEVARESHVKGEEGEGEREIETDG